MLSYIEIKFSCFRRQLEQKVFDKNNINNTLLFSEEEKNFWKVFFVVQCLRMPQIMRVS